LDVKRKYWLSVTVEWIEYSHFNSPWLVRHCLCFYLPFLAKMVLC